MTLVVTNIGNLKATDIRVRISIPSWIIAFDDFPKYLLTPQKPILPKPIPPQNKTITNYGAAAFKEITYNSKLIHIRGRSEPICYLENNEIIFNVNSILHKHNKKAENFSFYILANSNAPVGSKILKGKAFCSEYEDWHDISVKLNIV